MSRKNVQGLRNQLQSGTSSNKTSVKNDSGVGWWLRPPHVLGFHLTRQLSHFDPCFLFRLDSPLSCHSWHTAASKADWVKTPLHTSGLINIPSWHYTMCWKYHMLFICVLIKRSLPAPDHICKCYPFDISECQATISLHRTCVGSGLLPHVF